MPLIPINYHWARGIKLLLDFIFNFCLNFERSDPQYLINYYWARGIKFLLDFISNFLF